MASSAFFTSAKVASIRSWALDQRHTPSNAVSHLRTQAFFIMAWVKGGMTSRGWFTKASRKKNAHIFPGFFLGPLNVASQTRLDDILSTVVTSQPVILTSTSTSWLSSPETEPIGLVNGSPSAGSGLSTKSILQRSNTSSNKYPQKTNCTRFNFVGPVFVLSNLSLSTVHLSRINVLWGVRPGHKGIDMSEAPIQLSLSFDPCHCLHKYHIIHGGQKGTALMMQNLS